MIEDDAESTGADPGFDVFTSRLTHDLREIFGNIEGFAGALQEQAADRLTQREARYLQRIAAGAQRGESVMRDVAALCAAAQVPMHRQPLDIDELLRRAIQDLAPRLEGRTVAWELPERSTQPVLADPALLRLAIDHLLANAVKFTRGREPARIRIELAGDSRRWVVCVSDNGVGFDPAYGGRLFQPFERLHLPTEFEGNGAGLALVRTVARRHGGDAGAQAREEGGARFSFSLARDTAGGALPAGSPAPAVAGAAAGLRVLVVDDEPLVLATLKAMLERDGHHLLAAGGGAEGLQLLAQHARAGQRLDLVITDWLMPQVGGAEVVRAAGALQPPPRIIVLTGQRPDPRGRDAIPPSVGQVLQKPLRLSELRQALARAFGPSQGGVGAAAVPPVPEPGLESPIPLPGAPP